MTFDPYAAPESVEAPPGTPDGPPRGRYLKWVYAVVSATAIVGAGATHVVAFDADVLAQIGVIDQFLGVARLVVGLVWLHAAWAVIPASVCNELRMTPSKAVVFNFIPCVNLYWLFAVQQKLCEAIDTVLSRAARPNQAPRPLAVLAPTAHLAAGLLALTKEPRVVLAGHVVVCTLWLAYMFQCDAALGAVRAALARRAPFVADS